MVDVKYTAEFDAARANRALESLHKNVVSINGAAPKLSQTLKTAEIDVRNLATSTARFVQEAPAAVAVKGRWATAAENLNKKMAPQAAAISGITAALGAQGGQLGKTVAGVGQLAAAFAAGGPLALALTGTIVGVEALSRHWDDLIAKQDKAIAANFANFDKAVAEKRAIEAEIDGLRVQGGVITPRDAINLRADRTVADAEARIQKMRDEINKNYNDPAARRFTEEEKADRFAAITQLKEIVELTERRRNLEQGLAGTPNNRDAQDAYAKGLRDLEASGNALVGYGLGPADNDPLLAADRETADLQRRAAEMRRQDILTRHKNDLDAAAAAAKTRLEIQKTLHDAEYRAAEEQAARLQAVRDHYNQAFIDGAAGAFSVVVGAGQQLAIDLATSQEHAAERAAASVLSGIGNQLVGLGTKAVVEGTLMSLNPLTPGIGVPLALGGAAAIGIGIGMGAGGAALSASLPSASSAAKDPGVNRRSLGGNTSNGGGGMNVTINYGVAGPSAEDTAQEIARVERVRMRRDI